MLRSKPNIADSLSGSSPVQKRRQNSQIEFISMMLAGLKLIEPIKVLEGTIGSGLEFEAWSMACSTLPAVGIASHKWETTILGYTHKSPHTNTSAKRYLMPSLTCPNCGLVGSQQERCSVLDWEERKWAVHPCSPAAHLYYWPPRQTANSPSPKIGVGCRCNPQKAMRVNKRLAFLQFSGERHPQSKAHGKLSNDDNSKHP